MKTYEELQEIARQQGVDVIDNYTFTSERIDGLYCDSTVAISKNKAYFVRVVWRLLFLSFFLLIFAPFYVPVSLLRHYNNITLS